MSLGGQQPALSEDLPDTVSAPLASYYPFYLLLFFLLHSLSLELCAEMYWVGAGTEEAVRGREADISQGKAPPA